MPDDHETAWLKLHGRIAEIPAAEWDACTEGANPFVGHAFLSALEDSGSTGTETGWIPQHIVLRDQDGHLVAAVPAYIKLHSFGEYVFDQSWAEAFERAGGNYYPKLQVSVPFSPVPGPRLLRNPKSNISIHAIGDAIKKVADEFDISSAHVTFCTEEEMKQLAQAGWLPRLGMQFHWHNQDYKNFGDFLGSLRSSHRKTIRRERRDANNPGLVFQTLRGGDIKSQHWDAFHQFYIDTIDKKWGSAYLTRDCFALLSERLADKIVLMMALNDGTPIAGALNILGNDTLYGRNWGSRGQWPFLHFELCYYRAIDFAIEHKLKRVEAGAQGQHKIQRGYLPQLTCSVHYVRNQGLSNAVERFLVEERKAIMMDAESFSSLSPFRNLNND